MIRWIRKFLGLQDRDPSIIKQKSKNKKNIGFLLFFDFFITFYPFKTEVNVPLISKKQTTTFCWHLKITEEKSRIRIRESVLRICVSGSVPKCNESAILKCMCHPCHICYNMTSERIYLKITIPWLPC
jgi:hypothetical protein